MSTSKVGVGCFRQDSAEALWFPYFSSSKYLVNQCMFLS